MRIRLNVRPDSPNQNGAVVEGVLAVELSPAVPEFANERLCQFAEPAVGEELAPLMCLRVVEKESEALPVTVRSVSLDLFQERAPVPDLVHRDGAVELDRLSVSRQRVGDALDMGVPHAEVEIEIVLPIVLRDLHCRSRLAACRPR